MKSVFKFTRTLALMSMLAFAIVFSSVWFGIRLLPCYVGGDVDAIVETACNRFANGARIVAVRLNNDSDLDLIMNKIYDDPELFWLGATYKASMLGPNTIITVNERYPDVDEKSVEINKVAQAIVDELIADDMSEYDRVLAIHDWICENVEYESGTNNSDQDIYGALVLRKAVCAGYAKSFTYLLDRADIESYVISGHAVKNGKTGEAHAWNLIYIDGEPYYFDITWNDEGDCASYNWFGITHDEFATRHKPGRGYEWVDVTSSDANYYVRNGMYIEAYSADVIAQLIMNQGDVVCIKCANSQVLEDVLTAFKTDSERDVISEKAGLGTNISVLYSYDTDTNCVTMQIGDCNRNRVN